MKRSVAVVMSVVSLLAVLAGAGASAASTGGGAPRWTAEFDQGVGAASWAVAASPDGSTVFVTGVMDSGSATRFATVAYDASTGAQKWAARLPSGDSGESGFAKALAVSPDGTRLFVTGYLSCGHGCDGPSFRGFVTVAYDASTGERLWISRLQGGNGPEVVDVSPDGATVLVIGIDGSHLTRVTQIVAYDAATGGQRWLVERETGTYGTGLDVTPDGDTVIVADAAPGGSSGCWSSSGYRVEAYDTTEGTLAWSRVYPMVDEGSMCGAPTDLELSPDGATVYVNGYASVPTHGESVRYRPAVLALHTATGAPRWTAREDDARVMAGSRMPLAVAPDGARVYALAEDSYCRNSPWCPLITTAYDAATGERLWVSRFDGGGYAYAAELAVGPGDSSVYVTGALSMPCLAGCTAVRRESPVIAYDAETGDEQWVTTYADSAAEDLALSPDGASVYLAGSMSAASTPTARPMTARSAMDGCSEQCGYTTTRYNTGPGPGTSQDSETSLRYDGWRGAFHKTAVGGAFRTSDRRGQTAAFRTPKVSSFSWLTREGPDQGMARVVVDGRHWGTFDLYSPTPASRRVVFDDLAHRRHTVRVTVLGRKAPASTGTFVAVDGFTFRALHGIAQESSFPVRFGSWEGRSVRAASGGTWRASGSRGARMSFDFRGRAVRWITATGPAFGRAHVVIDGDARRVDLYRARRSTRVPVSFRGLSRGAHRITVIPLGTKDRDSRSTDVVVDAFVVPR